MSIEKPLPLMVGNKAYYSLTSYDPVEITVEVPYTSEEEVAYALEMTVGDMGGTPADLDDPAWLAAHFEGRNTRAEVREAMRQELRTMNAQMAEQQKLGKCVEALTERLAQSVPAEHIAQAKEAIQARFTQQLQAEGLTPSQFIARSGTSPDQLEAMFDRQARQMAEGDAALSAYAHEKKLKVDEHEYERLLGLPAEDLKTVMDQARAVGQLDELREAALRSKAAQIVVAECSCTYEHETPEHARVRMLQYRQMKEMYDQNFGADSDEGEEEKTGFKLV